MSEHVQENGNPVHEGEQDNQTLPNGQENGNSEQEGEVIALSVKNNSDSRQPLKLQLRQHTNLPNQRPVEASHLRVVETYSSVGGERPIVASGLEITGMLTVSGKRPIGSSHLKISNTYSVMGNRPVASNEIDDPTALMGYID